MGLSYSGEIAEWKTALIRNAAVAGALNQIAHAHERANLVNAASIAEERGIRLTERKNTRDAGGAAANVLRMTFKTGQQENTVAGCVQPGGLPRLLEIDGIRRGSAAGRQCHLPAQSRRTRRHRPRRDGAGSAQRQHRQLLAGPRPRRAGSVGGRSGAGGWRDQRGGTGEPCAASKPSCWPRRFASERHNRKRFRREPVLAQKNECRAGYSTGTASCLHKSLCSRARLSAVP